MTYTYSIEVPLERGTHDINAQVTNLWKVLTSDILEYQAAYELTTHGIDLYVGEKKLDAWDISILDVLIPELPTLTFTSAEELGGDVVAIVRERGLRTYQFQIRWVDLKNGVYQYKAVETEIYALSLTLQKLQIPYSTTNDLIGRVAPQLYPVGTDILTETVQEQQFVNVKPVDLISQMLIQNKAQGHVRNGNLYVLPLDVSAEVPIYHTKRTDPLVSWSRDANLYNIVRAHYLVNQYPVPETILTNHDAANWTGTVTDAGVVATTLLAAPSGAAEMLKSVGNCSRANLSANISLFDRLRFNWCPVTATTMTVTLQQDANNKLVYTKTFAGAIGAGTLIPGAPGIDAAGVVTRYMAMYGKYVVGGAGAMTQPCSYRVALLDAAAAVIWQSEWRGTLGNYFGFDVPESIYLVCPVTTIRLEFTNLYVIGNCYGAQMTECSISYRAQVAVQTGSYTRNVSTRWYSGTLHKTGDSTDTYWMFETDLGAVQGLNADESYRMSSGRFNCRYLMWETPTSLVNVDSGADAALGIENGHLIASWGIAVSPTFNLGQVASVQLGPITASVVVQETIVTNALVWQTMLLDWAAWLGALPPDEADKWTAGFNQWESVDIPISQMTKTGNPQFINTVAFAFTGDNYLDGICLVASDPQVQSVEVGAGDRVYEVTDVLSSYEGALSYARGLLPIVSKAREQYTRDLPLTDELGVGDTVECDGVNMTVYACEYRQDGKTIAVGKQLDTTQTQLREQSRRIGALERR